MINKKIIVKTMMTVLASGMIMATGCVATESGINIPIEGKDNALNDEQTAFNINISDSESDSVDNDDNNANENVSDAFTISKSDSNYTINESEAKVFFAEYILTSSGGNSTILVQNDVDRIMANSLCLQNEILPTALGETFFYMGRKGAFGSNDYVDDFRTDLIEKGLMLEKDSDRINELSFELGVCNYISCEDAQLYFDDFYGKGVVDVSSWESNPGLFISSAGYILGPSGYGDNGTKEYTIDKIQCFENVAVFTCSEMEVSNGDVTDLGECQITLYKDGTGVHFFSKTK